MSALRRGSGIALAVATLAILLLAGRAVSELVVDRAWYSALNGEPVFWETFTDSVILRGCLWALGAAFAFLNLYAVRRTILAVAVPARVANLELTAMLPSRRLLAFTLVCAALVGLLLALPFDDWTAIALARHGIPFREIENYFERDLGFFVYWLPVEESLYVWALLTIVVMIAIVVLLYTITRSLRVDGRRIISTTHARRHLTVLGVLVMFLLAWSYRLDGYDLLRYGSGADGLFLRVDHVVTLKIDFILGMLSIFAAMVLLRAGWVGQVRLATATLTVVLLGALAVRHGLPSLLENGSALGSPVRRDMDYVAARALITRRAYDVDAMAVVTEDSSARASVALTLADLPANVSTWDAAPLSRALGPVSDTRVTVAPVSWFPGASGVEGLLLQKPELVDAHYAERQRGRRARRTTEHRRGFCRVGRQRIRHRGRRCSGGRHCGTTHCAGRRGASSRARLGHACGGRAPRVDRESHCVCVGPPRSAVAYAKRRRSCTNSRDVARCA
jgi:uncharacterized membrane protein (UPF0182 family)